MDENLIEGSRPSTAASSSKSRWSVLSRLKSKVHALRHHDSRSAALEERDSRAAECRAQSRNAEIIDEEELTLLRRLGAGEFGQVWQALWSPRDTHAQNQVWMIGSI